MRKVISFLRNKYILSSLVFLIWLFFFDNNDIITQIRLRKKISQMREDKGYYLKEIQSTKKELYLLMTDPDNLEKFAREKYLMKKAFKGILPDSILFRKKRGFSTPLSVWLRKDLRQFTHSIFTKERFEATNVLDYKGVQSLLTEHLSRKANNQGVLFALLTFVLWHERYIQQDATNAGAEGLQKP